MTERDPGALALERLFKFFNHKPDKSDLRVYVRALRDYPTAFVVAAVDRAMESRTFLPKPNELVADAAACRGEAVDATPRHTACAACEASPGWVSVVDDKDIARLKRCACWDSCTARGSCQLLRND